MRRAISLEQRNAFRGRVIAVDLERVELPNGSIAQLEIIRHPGGAAAVAINARGEVCLLRQYRHALGGWLWELPAGKLDDAEKPLLAARRELAEEAGVRAARWRTLGEFVSSPGVFTDVVHLFLATGLEPTPARPEASEVFDIRWVSLERALALALAGKITDGKTVVGLVRAAARLQAIKSKRRKS
ncbi:MAG TPA: NUDIX hydrolase [Steroidobacteraceae bacterium]|nr:NUDIX hydrolase [Steroidobacteraceae bacterium]